MSVQQTLRTIGQSSFLNAQVTGFGLLLGLGLGACQRVSAQSTINESQQQAQDYNRYGGAQAPNGPQYPQSQYPPDQYSQQPSAQQQPVYNGNYSDPGYANPAYGDQGYTPSPEDIEADQYAADLTAEAANEPPPPLPDYEQPPCPDPDYLWTPGYWGWGPYGYYWVPGAWVAAPYAGALWTPGYWAFVGSAYRFHHGFWGLHIGFYGGIPYGYGYTGYGYYGGYWRDNHFFYNTAVNRVNDRVIRNVYTREVVVNNRMNRVSYNGGRGGLDARPRPAELAVLREQRIPPMQSQLAIRREAEGNRAQFYNQNHGRPPMTVAARPVAADRTLPSPLSNRPGMQQGGVRNGYQADGNRYGYQGNGSPGRGVYGGAPQQQDNRGFGQGQRSQAPNVAQPQGGFRQGQPGAVQQVPNAQPQTQSQPNANRQPYNRSQPYVQQQNQPGVPQQNNQPGADPRFGNRGRGSYTSNQPSPAPQPQAQPQTQPQPQAQPQQGRPNYDNRGAQPNFRRGNAPETQVTGTPPARVDQAPQQQPQWQRQQQQNQPQWQQRPQQQAQPQWQQRQQPQQQPQFQQRQQQPQAQPQPQVQQRPQQPQFRQMPQPRNDQPHEEHGRSRE